MQMTPTGAASSPYSSKKTLDGNLSREENEVRHLRVLVWLPASAVIACLLAGCGGGGGGGGTAAVSPFAGTYSADYTRAETGTLTIAVGANGGASIVITDSALDVLTGTGSVSAAGQLTATAANETGTTSVGVSGQFVSQGGIITASGSITGAMSVNWSASQIAEAGVNAFAGNWSGTYTGTESGTWQAVIQTNGQVSATAQSPTVGTVNLGGTVAPAGSATLQGSGSGIGGPFTITWTGTFRMQISAAVGSGTWVSSSGFNGTWSGQRQ